MISSALHYYASLKGAEWSRAEDAQAEMKRELAEMESLIGSLPTSSGDIDSGMVGNQLDEEMKMMDTAIQQAVALIEQMQKTAREKDSGMR